jgi:hypothetical protein
MRTVWPFLLSRSVFAKSNKKLIFLVLKVRRFARHVPVEQKSYKTSRKLSFSPTDTVDKRKNKIAYKSLAIVQMEFTQLCT